MQTFILSIVFVSLLILPVSSDRISFQRTRNPSAIGSSFLIQASRLRTVPINNTDQVGFYVNVDLANGADSLKLSPKDSDPSYASMTLALYSSETLLASSCEKFYKYDCEKYQCKDSGNMITSDFAYFTAEGHSITAKMTLEKSSWILGSSAIFATNCKGNAEDDFGLGVYGIIGLGVENLASKNYQKKEIQFSVFLKQDITQGELIFSKDFSKATSETPVATFTANNNWHVKDSITIEVGDGAEIKNLKGKLIFDLHAEVTGLPLSYYQDLLEWLSKAVKNTTLECPKGENSYYKPVCHFTEGDPVFPNITLIVGEKEQAQKLVLTPEIYVEYVKKTTGSVKLNIKALSSTLKQSENYVTPSYDNYIILDSTVLSYYYTVFEVGAEPGKNKISFYVANHKKEGNSNSLIAYIILGVFVVLLLFFGFLTYSSYLKKQKARDGLFTNSSLFDQAKRMDHSLASSTS